MYLEGGRNNIACSCMYSCLNKDNTSYRERGRERILGTAGRR